MNEEKSWQSEQKRVDTVVNEIDRKMKALTQHVGNVKSDVLTLRKSFWDDVTVNLDDPDDVIETVSSIKQQAELLSERERSHGLVHKQIKTLEKLRENPYFGRIDFLETGEREIDRVYIGIASLRDAYDDEFLVYDWRAPISSLYYDYSPGSAQYDTPSGIIKGEIELKRQYVIKNGKINGLFDTGITIGDELLQKVLGNNANTQMKSIVATIQKEQNQIIRNERNKILVVQGVAGSGKTSAALQRVAYLLYRYRETLNADNIILFSPNPMFNSYIATVLPELGEENMQQTTFQQYIAARIGNRFEIEDPFMQMEYVLSAMDDTDYDTRIHGIRYKAQLQFKGLIDQYVTDLSESGLIFKNIKFKERILIPAKEIYEQFYSYKKSISITNRIQLIEEWIIKKLREYAKTERKKSWVEDEISLLDKEDFLKVYRDLQNKERFTEDTFNDLDREQEYLEKIVVNRHFKPLFKRVKKLQFINHLGMYKQLFNLTQTETSFLPEQWDSICEHTLKRLGKGELSYEDATPYLYLQDQIEGRKPNTAIRHVFIDEAQDYSPFQFAFIKQVFPNSKMTLLGDINQAIYSHAVESQSLVSPNLVDKTQIETYTLTRSYRSTSPIVEFTRGIIANGHLIEAFNRDGNKPTLTVVKNKSELHEKMDKQIHNYLEDGHKTIAVICKTAGESEEAYHALKDKLEVRLIKKDSSTYEEGILIIPSYLAKGIEFDAVIIYDASKESYGRESERKLFYTACTRAMHELSVFSIGETTSFINDVSDNSFILYN